MNQSLGYLAALSSLIVYALSTLLTRLATDRVRSDLGVMVVTTVGVLSSIAVLLAMLCKGWMPSDTSPGPVLAFCASGLFSAYLGRWLFFESVVKLGPARASAFQTSVPVFTALFGWLLLGEHLGGSDWLAITTTLVGLLLVSQQGSIVKVQVNFGSVRRWNLRLLFIGLGSSLAYAAGHVCRGYAVRIWNEPLLGVLLGAVTGLVLQLLAGGSNRVLWSRLIAADRVGLGIFAAVGLLGMIAQLLAIWAMLSLSTGKVALIMTATPLLVFPASWLFFKRYEIINGMTVFGLLMALIGITYLMVV